MRTAARAGRVPRGRRHVPATRSGGSSASSTDAAGHYSIRVGPGTYTLMGPPRTEDEKITIKDETELVRDFRMPRPEKGPFTGRVVRADDLSKGVAGAKRRDRRRKLIELPFPSP